MRQKICTVKKEIERNRKDEENEEQKFRLFSFFFFILRQKAKVFLIFFLRIFNSNLLDYNVRLHHQLYGRAVH